MAQPWYDTVLDANTAIKQLYVAETTSTLFKSRPAAGPVKGGDHKQGTLSEVNEEIRVLCYSLLQNGSEVIRNNWLYGLCSE